MEFLDEDARPRFLFQSKAPNSSFADPEEEQKKFSKPFIFITISISSLLLVSSIFFVQSEPSKSLLLWVALSILLGPFAPISITGGDIRVGRGPILDLPDETLQSDEETKKKAPQKRSKPRRSEETGFDPAPVIETTNGSAKEQKKNVGNSNGGVAVVEEEKDWNEEDIEILKKQLLKNPVGKPKRWEVIAEAFRGRHKVDSVIKKSKELGEKRSDDGDSYAQFLKKRKPVDKRADGGNEGSDGGGGGGFAAEEGESRKENWSSAEDIALLNALKAFPKEVSMRWEKIAAAVPGKSKAGCIKRVSELKKDFRSSKAATEA
ncbi:hypothetical protein UlMin_001402 [Ulmus minor]